MKINSVAMQSHKDNLPDSVKCHFKMDETSGLFIVNRANGSHYVPGAAPTFNEPNAVTIDAPDGAITKSDFNVTLDTSKVILLAGCLKQVPGENVRFGIGVSLNTNNLVISTFSGLHGYFENAEMTDGASPRLSPSSHLWGDNGVTAPHIYYALFDGTNFTIKILDLDGAVPNGALDPFPPMIRTTPCTWAASEITLGNIAKLDGGHMYGMSLWQLDSLPDNLDLQLANWGSLLVAGNKGAVEF